MKTLYWNRTLGKFVNKNTGEGIDVVVNGILYESPKFTGNVREWYETLIETLIDLRNQLHKEAAQSLGNCNAHKIKVTCDPNVWCMIQSSVLFHPSKDKPTVSGTVSDMSFNARKTAPRMQLVMEATFKGTAGRTKTLKGCVKVVAD